jgi:methyl-accepting chemotaxis protein
MSIRKMFIAIFSSFVLLLVLLGFISILMLNNQTNLNESQQIRYLSYQAADELRQSSMDLTRLARTYVSTGDSKYEDLYWEVLDIRNGKKTRPDGRTIALNQIMKDLGFTDAEFAKITEAGKNSDGLVWTETIAMNAVKGLFHDANKEFTIKKQPDFKLARELMFNAEYHQFVVEIMAPINDFFRMLDERTKGQVEEYVAKSDRYLWYALSVILLLIIVSVLSYALIHKRLSVPVAALVGEVKLMGDGDLTRLIHSDAKDEIGELSRTVDNMRRKMGQTVGESMAVVQTLAEASSAQAASGEETSSSLEEMSSMTKQNSDNANNANSLMQEANQVITSANNSMGDLTTSMGEISKASEETQKIVKTIDEIAFQTNLLALNAAVEAARAGEAGAGFAVVADEVRNLAMRAADAAKSTADLIEGTVKKIKGGVDLVETTNEGFSKVAESSGKVGDLLGEIAAASKEQAQGIEQINIAVTQMDKVTQQNAAGSEELSSIMSSFQTESVNKSSHSIKTIRNVDNQSGVALPEKISEVKADQVIPFDDDESFKDF